MNGESSSEDVSMDSLKDLPFESEKKFRCVMIMQNLMFITSTVFEGMTVLRLVPHPSASQTQVHTAPHKDSNLVTKITHQ